MSHLTNKQLASRLRGIGASQKLALLAFAEDGSCTEYLIDAAARLERLDRFRDWILGGMHEGEYVGQSPVELWEMSAPDCVECEGSGESGHVHHDGTRYSTKEPPCSVCGGSGKAS